MCAIFNKYKTLIVVLFVVIIYLKTVEYNKI